MKLFVCSDISPLESLSSTSPSHLPALPIAVSVAVRAYDTKPEALVVNTKSPFITKTPPASSLILKKINLPKGSGEPNKEKVGVIKKSQIKEIAELKMEDLNV